MVNGLIIAAKNGTGQSNKPHCAYLKKPKENPITLYKREAPSCRLERNLAISLQDLVQRTFVALKEIYKVRRRETK